MQGVVDCRLHQPARLVNPTAHSQVLYAACDVSQKGGALMFAQ